MKNEQWEMVDLDGTPEEGEEQRPEKTRRKSRRAGERPKKRHVFRNTVIAAALVIAGLIGYRSFAARNVVPTVEAYEVQKGDLEQIVSISGTVTTDEEKSYYAKASVPVETVHVAVGDTVKKGDLLISFDQSQVELMKQTTSLGQAAQTGNYDNSMQQEAKNQADYAEANYLSPILDEQVTFINDWIQEIQLKITEKQQRMQQTYLELQAAYAEESRATKPDKDKLDKLQALQYESQIAQNNDPEINAWRKQIEDLQQELVKFQQDKTEMESQQKTSEAQLLNPGAINALNANQQSSSLQTQDTLEHLAEASQGITADFNGVVTELMIREGATPAPGMELIHIASSDAVKVAIQITKADLEKVSLNQDVTVTIAGHQYDGKVSKIAGSATCNAGGMAVVQAEVSLQNPDEYVIIGVEADTDIHAREVKNAVVLPYEYINTDSEGDFVFAIKDGKITRIPVEIGITTDVAVEVTSGLQGGEMVTANLPDGVTEGTTVETVPVSEKQENMMNISFDIG